MYITGWDFLNEECLGADMQDLLARSMKATWDQLPNAWNITPGREQIQDVTRYAPSSGFGGSGGFATALLTVE